MQHTRLSAANLRKKNMTPKKTAVASSDKVELVRIPELDIQQVQMRLVGDTPLIMHRWSNKAKEMMRAKQQKGAKLAKEAKVPEYEFNEATYFIDREKGVYGFPVLAIKKCLVTAAVAGDAKMSEMRRAFHIVGDVQTAEGSMSFVHAPKRIMREDMVRIAMGTADLRYRPEFPEWHIDVNIRFDRRQISVAQIFSLANLAGFSVGLGEWRVEKSGQSGMFHVEASA